MISDFFCPRLGGVENHILNLSKELRKMGHTIIVITHSGSGRKGVQYVDGFKVYYLEMFSMFSGSVFPTILCTAAPIVQILLYESVDVVHGHQCSTLAIEGVLHSRILGIPTCFTNHSLVKTESLGGIITESTFQLGVRDSDKIICVSGATKDNTADRLGIHGESIAVIPNAVTEDFKPIPLEEGTRKNEIVISVVTRLTARKGARLLADALPRICRIDPRIRIVIAGDGEKRELLEQTVDRHKLKDKVSFLGGVNPSEVKNVLNRSNLFLNTSLTEAFCISIIEAAACGLYVVSTDVDGISEVLPKDMITLVPPTVDGILAGIRASIPKIEPHDREVSHRRVHSMYKWSLVAKRTNEIYCSIAREQTAPLVSRINHSIRRIYSAEKGRFCIVFLLLLLANYAVILLLALSHANRKRKHKAP
ncbi:phosphatidylinositol N-acetylglucosaminyltransferase subunit A [Nematocida major]|uniref:phosphatidylinositol N-acetylglucosaminyltransferase subunit A n=1 Tax=Nematocida major TaxID=1912982 RepID=UPI00200848D8|nr:phosphatidylinositol N-acetylglucosaminyltransferase subunit A [Nematocida major]KAH9387156.1 phosphatidylinositol N-acetylglucosaminyltransferase subunit A [Nematocida major]